ncbi:unnamed protein product [Symbiodinium sp. CCMP2592]|nr:unnamed protein product [Symbiodinium sp. CCMP2592]
MVAANKQTQSMLSSLRTEIMSPLQQLHANAAGHSQVRSIEQNLDLANQTVWQNQGHLKGQDDMLESLGETSEKIQQVLLKLQTQMEKVITRLTPPQHKAPPPPAPPTQPSDPPASEAAPKTAPSGPSTASTPSPISPMQGNPQPEVPILRIQEALPLRQPLSLFPNLQNPQPMQWTALQNDARARDALAYLAQACGMLG